MAFKTFAPGVLTSSDVNTFLMRQAVITCTSSTRPASPSEGMTIFETDTDRYLGYTGSAWKQITDLGNWLSYTPTLGGGTSAIGDGTLTGTYKLIGSTVHFSAHLVYGSTTTFDATGMTISTPTVGDFSAYVFGSGEVIDTSIGRIYGTVSLGNITSSSLGVFAPDPAVTGGIGRIRSGFPFTWQTGDEILISGTYRRSA